MINSWWRARKIERFFSQPFYVAERFTGIDGRYVPLKDTVRGFREILDGKCDDLPEQAFMMAGTIEDVREKADQIAEECVILCRCEKPSSDMDMNYDNSM